MNNPSDGEAGLNVRKEYAGCIESPNMSLSLGPPGSCPLPTFWGEGSPTKIDYRKKIGFPDSILSTGGPRKEDE